MTRDRRATFAGVEARRTPPTRRHRPALWGGILGTVYAMNDAGEVRYFDYDLEGARAFAGVATDRDPRVATKKRRVRYTDAGPGSEPSVGQRVLWITKEDAQ